MRKMLAAAAAALLLAACVTFDVEKKVRAGASAGGMGGAGVVAVPIDTGPPPPPEIIERPVYVPAGEAPPKPAGTRGLPAAEAAASAAASAGTLRPEEFSHASVIYDYDADWVYEAYCQPMRATDIRLEAGERMAETPFVSDSERWKIGAGVSYENGQAIQHVYVKPDDPGISASLIINTDRRVYHLIVRSYGAERNVHMPMVRWRYPGNAMPYAVAGAGAGGNAAPGGGGEADPAILADPRFLSFDYRITYPLFRKPRWTPELVYDDGKKTYVTFPGGTLQGELPAVFENRADVVNYRVIRDIIVIDRLVEALTVRIGNQSVIVRKRGRT